MTSHALPGEMLSCSKGSFELLAVNLKEALRGVYQPNKRDLIGMPISLTAEGTVHGPIFQLRKLSPSMFLSLAHKCVKPELKPSYLPPEPQVFCDLCCTLFKSFFPSEGQGGASKLEIYKGSGVLEIRQRSREELQVRVRL